MSSEPPTDRFDAPLSANDAAPLGLPRLRVIHLLLWTAATALALVPYQVQQQAQSQLSPGAAIISSAPATALGMVYGVAAGGFLFVTAALPFWKQRGSVFRLEPGHWLAIQGAAQWVVWALSWLAVLRSPQYGLVVFQWFIVPRFLLGFIFLLIYLRLVVRSRESLPWRWTYGALAVLPAAASCFTLIAPFVGWRRSQLAAHMLPHGAAAGVLGLLLLTALLDDLRGPRPRHWTHWLGAGMRCAVVASSAATYLYYGLNPGALGR